MKNLIIILVVIFMLGGSIASAETWSENSAIFEDFYTSAPIKKITNVGGVEQLCSPNEILTIDGVEYICPDTGIIIVGGTNYECTRELYYGRMWNGETVKGKFDNCLSNTSGGGDTYNTTTNETTNNTTNETNDITETCNGCPTITHKIKPVKQFRFK